MQNSVKRDTRINLLGLSRQPLEAFFAELGEKAFRASQLLKWVHADGVIEFAAMTNLSKALREKLSTIAAIELPELAAQQSSVDGTRKWLLRLHDGNAIETVYIPEKQRGTLCVSSQVGCALDCTFCATARQGFSRNLSSAEIIAQLWFADNALRNDSFSTQQITNVVMMGMGEPLLNLDNVVNAMHLMLDDHAYGLSKRRVTLSTSGVVPAMDKLRTLIDVSLAVSLHAPIDELRNRLVPINRKYPVSELIAACRRFLADKNHKHSITFEYVMLDGVNDSPALARELASLLGDIPAKVNLIPFNPFPQAQFKRSSQVTIDRFRDILQAAGVVTITRRPRGEDIDAACGQLVGRVSDRSHRQEHFVRLEKRFYQESLARV